MKLVWQALREGWLLLVVQLVTVSSGCVESVGNSNRENLYNRIIQKGCKPTDESPYRQGSQVCWDARCGQRLTPICMSPDTNEQ